MSGCERILHQSGLDFIPVKSFIVDVTIRVVPPITKKYTVMGSKADDIRSIANDGRYRPDTKLEKLCERLNLSSASEKALKDAFNEILSDAVERVVEAREDKVRSDDPLVQDMMDLLTRRTKNWIQEDQTDLISLIRMMHQSAFFEDINASKQFLKGLESDLQVIRDRIVDRQNED